MAVIDIPPPAGARALHMSSHSRSVISSCLVFIPRGARPMYVERIAHFLINASGKKLLMEDTRSTVALARLHYVLRLDTPSGNDVDVADLGGWFRRRVHGSTICPRHGRVARSTASTNCTCGATWPRHVRTTFDATEALADLPPRASRRSATTSGSRSGSRSAPRHPRPQAVRMRRADHHLEVLPRLSNIGMIVDDQHPYEITPKDLGPRWMKSFRLPWPVGTFIDPPRCDCSRKRRRRRPRRRRRIPTAARAAAALARGRAAAAPIRCLRQIGAGTAATSRRR